MKSEVLSLIKLNYSKTSNIKKLLCKRVALIYQISEMGSGFIQRMYGLKANKAANNSMLTARTIVMVKRLARSVQQT